MRNLVLTELRVLSRYRATLVWFFLMPVVFALFFGLAFSGSRGTPKISLGVVNEDTGFLGRRLLGELATEDFDVTDVPAAAAAADSSAATPPARTLTIPEGFTDSVLAGEKTSLLFRKTEDANVEASRAAEVNIYTAIIRIIGNLCLMQLEATGAGGKSSEEAYDLAVPKEPRVSIRIESAGSLAEIPSGFALSVPANIVMFVMMCVLIYGVHLLVTEKRSGLLTRISAGPVSASEIVAARLASRAMAGAVQVVILFAVSKLLFGIEFGTSLPGLFLLMSSYVLCVAGLSLLLGSLIRSPEQASGISVLLTLVMSALGGCWWPLEIVPSPMREVAFAFPTGWAMDGLHKVMVFGHGAGAVLPNVAALLVMFTVFFFLASRFMRRNLGKW
jgi:ABC-type multidrug transport system permease subunit